MLFCPNKYYFINVEVSYGFVLINIIVRAWKYHVVLS